MDPRATTFIVVAVVVGCFSVLLPNVFWPLIRGLLAGDRGPSPQSDPRGPGPGPRGRNPGQMNPNLRSTHPSQPPKPQRDTPSQGGKGGYLGFVLPMYAVGISLYLIFTLFKIFVAGGGRNAAAAAAGRSPGDFVKDLGPEGQAEMSRSIREVDRFLRMADGAPRSRQNRVELSAGGQSPREERRDDDDPASFEDELRRRRRRLEEEEDSRRRVQEEEEEKANRRRVQSMLYELKDEAESQGKELQRCLGATQSEGESSVREEDLVRLQRRLEKTEQAMLRVLAAMGHPDDQLEEMLEEDRLDEDQFRALIKNDPFATSGAGATADPSPTSMAPEEVGAMGGATDSVASALVSVHVLEQNLDREGGGGGGGGEDFSLNDSSFLGVENERKEERKEEIKEEEKEETKFVNSSNATSTSQASYSIASFTAPAAATAAAVTSTTAAFAAPLLASPDRDSLDDATAAAWEAAWADSTAAAAATSASVETIGRGFDVNRLRERVGGGGGGSGGSGGSGGFDLNLLRSRISAGNRKREDWDEEEEEEEELYENDSVEMEEEERREIDLIDSLVEDDELDGPGQCGHGRGPNPDGVSSLKPLNVKENSPVLRTAFTDQEVKNLRHRIILGQNDSDQD